MFNFWDLLSNGVFVDYAYKHWASALLVVLVLCHVGQAFRKRLWLLPTYPEKLLALNAGTLALLSLIAKVPLPPADDVIIISIFLPVAPVLICAMIGALFPSIATSPDLSGLWSNVAAVALLLLTTIVTMLLHCHFDNLHKSDDVNSFPGEYYYIMVGLLFVLFLVLLTQALALKAMIMDVKGTVSEQLEQLHLQMKPGYKAGVINDEVLDWSWEVVERNTHVKLMMVITSKPQHVISRSPCAAIVGALVFCSIILLGMQDPWFFIDVYFLGFLILLCGFISLWRWVRMALQENRPFQSLFSNTQPSFWLQEINNLRHKLKASRHRMQPNFLQVGQYGFKEVLLYLADLFLVCSVIPINRLVVAIIWHTHVLSALIIQNFIYLPFSVMMKLIFLPVKALWMSICTFSKQRASGRINTVIYPSVLDMSLGVVCVEGEDVCIIRQEFAKAANHIIRKQHKRACTKPEVKAIINLLSTRKSSSSNGVRLDVLDEEGAPFVENLHVEHGYQYGWGLTIISLLDVMTKIEANALGMSEISERAMEAYWQATEMVKVVDEVYRPCIVCSKETYSTAVLSEWMKLPKKKPRCLQKGNKAGRSDVKQDLVDQVLEGILKTTEVDMTEFNKAKSSHGYVSAPWTLRAVVSYTRHTVCQNLLRWWIKVLDHEKGKRRSGEGGSNATTCVRNMVEHINILIGEFLVCCLLSLPAALDISMTEAVHTGSTTKIEKGLFLIGQGKRIWEGLQWPAPLPPAHTCGQLSHWIHLSSTAV